MNLNNINIAHRGIYDNKKIPENSLKAFNTAIKKNIPIEFDLQTLKDKTIIVFHDDNLKRMTGIDKKVSDCNYEFIKNVKLLNTTEGIPTFDDVLKLANEKVLLDIEIKNNNDLSLISNKLDEYNGEFIIKSFYPKYIRWFKKNRPSYKRGLLMTYKNQKFWYKSFLFLLFVYFYLKPCFFALDKNMVNYKKISFLKKFKPIIFWTIKTKSEINKYDRCGLICEKIF